MTIDVDSELAANLRRIGRNIATERELVTGWTQEELAGAVGMHPKSLAAIEAGESDITLYRLAHIAAAIGTPLRAIL